jgi:trimeric autotransporter adhesin
LGERPSEVKNKNYYYIKIIYLLQINNLALKLFFYIKFTKMKKLTFLSLITFSLVNAIAQNTAYGTGALTNNTTGTYNSAFGNNALHLNTIGAQNAAFGEGALSSMTVGYRNIGIGLGALGSNVAGGGNIAIGVNTLQSSSSSANVAIGDWSMIATTTGHSNVAVGMSSLYYNTTGILNTVVGASAGIQLRTGSYNTILGADFNGIGLVTGNANTLIGARMQGLPANLSNTIILADGNGNQRLYIDNNGNAGLGTTAPTARLEVNSNTAGVSGLKFTQLTSASATVAGNGKALSVDAAGNVVLTTAGASTSFFANATVGTDNIINTNTGGVIIGTGITTAPSGYKLYVTDGIITEKVKVAVKNSADWADYVFDEKYPLLDIILLDKYIAQNKHLPGIQSADKIKENGGFELGQTTVKLLEKIEELTLYVIQLKKEINQIKGEPKITTNK